MAVSEERGTRISTVHWAAIGITIRVAIRVAIRSVVSRGEGGHGGGLSLNDRSSWRLERGSGRFRRDDRGSELMTTNGSLLSSLSVLLGDSNEFAIDQIPILIKDLAS